MEKTNVMRILDKNKIRYKEHTYFNTDAISGTDVAKVLGENPDHVFKTLVTVGKSNQHYVFMIPVEKELNLKKAAKVVNEKSVEMVKSKDLLALTGYIHGGCSPIGMKKLFPTYFQEDILLYDQVAVSAGKRGLQVILKPTDLIDFVHGECVDVINDR